MIKNKKISCQNIAIIMLIAIFSIAGIIACSGDAITGSGGRRGYSYTQDDTDQTNEGPFYTNDSGNTNEAQKPEPEPKPTFPANTYMTVYAPFSGNDTQRVSYQDTNTLAQIWKDMINRKGMNDGTRWFIRDGDNRNNGGESMLNGNYYYFDKNLDIIHAGKYANKIKMKKFLGAAIVKYRRGSRDGTWVVAGLYETGLNKADDEQNPRIDSRVMWGSSYTRPWSKEDLNSGKLYGMGYCDYNNDNLNEFMRAIHNFQRGDLEVIVLNTGFKFGVEYGIDSYYCTSDNAYRKNKDNFLGKDPNVYDKKFNWGVNHSWNLEKFNFKFAYAIPKAWHLQ